MILALAILALAVLISAGVLAGLAAIAVVLWTDVIGEALWR
jgi:hypothetical protein